MHIWPSPLIFRPILSADALGEATASLVPALATIFNEIRVANYLKMGSEMFTKCSWSQL